MKGTLRLFCGGMALAAVGLGLRAQEMPQAGYRQERPFIRVTGEGTATGKPDEVRITIGVTTQAPTAQAASAQNAKQLADALAELRKLLPTAELKTAGYSLQPNYRYSKEGGTPIISGYTSSNQIQVKTDKLDQVGPLLDTVSRNGVNTIHSIQFGIKDEHALRSQAMQSAAKQARASADAMASALNLRVVRVLSAETQEFPSARPMMERAMMADAKMGNAPTPVEPGTIDVRSTIVLTVEIAP